MKNIDEQIEEILMRHEPCIYDSNGDNLFVMPKVIEGLSTLIQKEREEAVREFVKKVKRETIKNGWEWKASGGDKVFSFIECLSQTKGGKE